MTNDDDLTVSCKCGKVQITTRGGYHTHSLSEAGDLGDAASTLCRHGWLSRRWWQVGIAAIILIAASGLFIQERDKRNAEEAEKWCRVGEKALQDDRAEDAAAAFTMALEFKVAYRTYMLRSFAYWRMCDYDSTISDLEHAIVLDPSNPIAHRSMADAQALRHKR